MGRLLIICCITALFDGCAHSECAANDFDHFERHSLYCNCLGGGRCRFITTQDDVNDYIHVGDIDLLVAIHIGCRFITVTVQDDADDDIDIGDIDLAIAIDIANDIALT